MTNPLPPTDPSGEDDKLPGEAELAALYRQLPQREPGAALDAAVLRAAAQALEDFDGRRRTEPRHSSRESGDRVPPKADSGTGGRTIPTIGSAARRPRRRIPHWLVGLGSAASLVLVAGLAWHMRTTTTEQPMPANRAALPSPRVAAEPKQARMMADRAEAKPAALPADDAVHQSRRQADTHRATGAVSPAAVAELAPAPPAAPLRRRARNAMPASDKAGADRLRAAPAPMALAPPPPPLQEVSAAPVATPPPAPPAPPSPAVSAQPSASTAVDAKDSPAQELDKIGRLFAQGHDDEARLRLREFRHAHPQWPLPPALQARLPRP